MTHLLLLLLLLLQLKKLFLLALLMKLGQDLGACAALSYLWWILLTTTTSTTTTIIICIVLITATTAVSVLLTAWATTVHWTVSFCLNFLRMLTLVTNFKFMLSLGYKSTALHLRLVYHKVLEAKLDVSLSRLKRKFLRLANSLSTCRVKSF